MRFCRGITIFMAPLVVLMVICFCLAEGLKPLFGGGTSKTHEEPTLTSEAVNAFGQGLSVMPAMKAEQWVCEHPSRKIVQVSVVGGTPFAVAILWERKENDSANNR